MPNVELVTFDGKEPGAWIRKCVKYFKIYKVPMNQRIGIASPFLLYAADSWFHNWNRGGNHSWKEFERELCSRFGAEGLGDAVKS